MRTFASVALFWVFGVSPIAHSLEQLTDLEKKVCELTETLATTVMTGRQAARPMSEVVQKLSEASSESEDFIIELAIEAYDHPAYATESIRNNTITEFGSKYYSLCLQEVRKKRP